MGIAETESHLDQINRASKLIEHTLFHAMVLCGLKRPFLLGGVALLLASTAGWNYKEIKMALGVMMAESLEGKQQKLSDIIQVHNHSNHDIHGKNKSTFPENEKKQQESNDDRKEETTGISEFPKNGASEEEIQSSEPSDDSVTKKAKEIAGLKTTDSTEESTSIQQQSTADKAAKIEESTTSLGAASSSRDASTRYVIPRPLRRPTEAWTEDCVQSLEQVEPEKLKVVRENYALGDCIKRCAKCDWSGRSRKPLHTNATMATRYGSLACDEDDPEYIPGSGTSNLTLVERIFREFQQREPDVFVAPPPDAILLHLRLGDVIEWSRTHVKNMLLKGGDPKHNKHYRNSIKSVYE